MSAMVARTAKAPRPNRPGAARSAASSSAAKSRLQVVTAFVKAQLGDARHERRVIELAKRLLKALGPQSGLWHGPADLETLELGIMLHDVGRGKDDARHPELGARLIRKAPFAALPLSAKERRIVAYLARYHRGAVPKEGLDDILRKGEYRRAVRMLALLRAADTLDSRSSGSVRVRIRRLGAGNCLLIQLGGNQGERGAGRARKVLGKRKKFRLLEEVMGLRVELQQI